MKGSFQIDIDNFLKLSKDNPKINKFSNDGIKAIIFEITETENDGEDRIDWLSVFENSKEMSTLAFASKLIKDFGDEYVQELQEIAINLGLMEEELTNDNHLVPVLFSTVEQEIGLLKHPSFQQSAIECLISNEEINAQHLFNGNWLVSCYSSYGKALG